MDPDTESHSRSHLQVHVEHRPTATLYILEYVSVPVPRIIARSSTADNELGFDWILMEKVSGVTLKSVWHELDVEAKDRETRVVVQCIRQLRGQCFFGAVGSLYFREDLLDEAVCVTTPQMTAKHSSRGFPSAAGFRTRRKMWSLLFSGMIDNNCSILQSSITSSGHAEIHIGSLTSFQRILRTRPS